MAPQPFVAWSRQPGPLFVEHVDLGERPHESADFVDHFGGVPLAVADSGKPELSALPQVLVTDFSGGNVVAVARPVDDRADHAALVLQGLRLGDVHIDLEGQHEHGGHPIDGSGASELGQSKTGFDRLERLSSAIPLVVATMSIASHNFSAASPRGIWAITGPKKLASSLWPGWNVMIGVPTSLPVRSKASVVSAWMYSSCDSSRAALGRPGGNPHAFRNPCIATTGSSTISGRRWSWWIASPSTVYSSPTLSLPKSRRTWS